MRDVVVSLVLMVSCASLTAAELRPIIITLDRKLRCEKASVSSLEFSPDAKLMAALHESGLLEVWDTSSWLPPLQIPMAGNGKSIAFWRNDHIAATWGMPFTAKNSAIVLWTCGSGMPISKLPMAELAVGSSLCAFETSGVIISGAAFPKGGFKVPERGNSRQIGAIDVWSEKDIQLFASRDVDKSLGFDARLFNQRGQLTEHKMSVNALVAVSQGTSVIAAGEDGIGSGIISRFNIQNGELIWSRVVQKYPVSAICLCRSGGAFCLSSLPWLGIEDAQISPMLNMIRIFSVDSGMELLQWRTDHARVTSIASSIDFDVVATGGNDGRICLWSADNGKKIATYNSDLGEVSALKFSDAKKQLVAGGKTGEIRIYIITHAD